MGEPWSYLKARSRRYWYASRHYRLGRYPKRVRRKESFEPRRRAISEPPKRVRGCRIRGRRKAPKVSQEVREVEIPTVCSVPTASEYRRKITTLLKKRAKYQKYFERNLGEVNTALKKVALRRVTLNQSWEGYEAHYESRELVSTESRRIERHYDRMSEGKDLLGKEAPGKAKETLKKYFRRVCNKSYLSLSKKDRDKIAELTRRRKKQAADKRFMRRMKGAIAEWSREVQSKDRPHSKGRYCRFCGKDTTKGGICSKDGADKQSAEIVHDGKVPIRGLVPKPASGAKSRRSYGNKSVNKKK